MSRNGCFGIRWAAVLAVLLISWRPAVAAEPAAVEPQAAAEPAAAVEPTAPEIENAGPGKIIRAVVEEAKGTRLRQWVITSAASEAVRPSLGVVCVSVDPAVRAHADVPDGQGVMVNEVVKGSPAEKAGVKQYDILLRAGDEPLAKAEDLVKAVGESQGKEMTLELIRSGKKLSVAVTPQETRMVLYTPKADPKSLQVIYDWVTDLRKDKSAPWAARSLRVKSAGPWVIEMSGFHDKAFPDDLRISITKQGKEPAKIEVKRGDEAWATTEDKLDKLPEKVRPFVQQFLGRGPETRRVITRPPVTITESGHAPEKGTSLYEYVFKATAESDKPPWAASADVQKQLDQIERQLKEAVKGLRAVRQLHQAARPAEAEPKREEKAP